MKKIGFEMSGLDKKSEEFEKVKDHLFDEYMKQQIMENFLEEFSDYFDFSQTEVLRESLSRLGESEFVSAISLPAELRERMFEKMFELYNAGESMQSIINGYLDKVRKYDFGIGYHTSSYDIQPAESGEWNIKGTEADHRDDDRMMAYYSSHYRHLYKKKHPKFIYAVRSSLGDGSHKTDGNWNRADSLSVIMKVPFDEVVNYVESTAREKDKGRT